MVQMVLIELWPSVLEDSESIAAGVADAAAAVDDAEAAAVVADSDAADDDMAAAVVADSSAADADDARRPDYH